MKPSYSHEGNPFPSTMFSINREGNEDGRAHLSARWTVVEATWALDHLLLRDGDDVGGNRVEL
jgi:hypothetical protein